MGRMYSMTCRNKACRYHVDLREGPGMRSFAEIKTLERNIISGDEKAPEDIKRLLESGNELECVATYLCPTCRELQIGNYPYALELINVSPYGTIRNNIVHFVSGIPKCGKCNTELEFILNPRSSKNRCPKCGTNKMKVSRFGFYD